MNEWPARANLKISALMLRLMVAIVSRLKQQLTVLQKARDLKHTHLECLLEKSNQKSEFAK